MYLSSQDVSGLSASHMAAVGGHTHCVTVLVSHRAYLNLTDFSDERYTQSQIMCNAHIFERTTFLVPKWGLFFAILIFFSQVDTTGLCCAEWAQ